MEKDLINDLVKLKEELQLIQPDAIYVIESIDDIIEKLKDGRYKDRDKFASELVMLFLKSGILGQFVKKLIELF